MNCLETQWKEFSPEEKAYFKTILLRDDMTVESFMVHNLKTFSDSLKTVLKEECHKAPFSPSLLKGDWWYIEYSELLATKGIVIVNSLDLAEKLNDFLTLSHSVVHGDKQAKRTAWDELINDYLTRENGVFIAKEVTKFSRRLLKETE